MNPTREVKTERYSRTEGKMPAFVEGEVQKLLGAIETSTRRQRRSFGSENFLGGDHRHQPVHSAETRIAGGNFGHEIKDDIIPRIKCSICYGATDYLDLVRLTPLLARTRGTPEIKVGLIDGPVVIDHPDLATENIHEVPGKFAGACALSSSTACKHGTFVAGILSAKRDSAAPAICPDCSLLVRPIFPEMISGDR